MNLPLASRQGFFFDMFMWDIAAGLHFTNLP